MPSTMNLTRAARRENEPGLSGAEAVTVENVGIPDQVISAATEEQTALGAFKDDQLQMISLLSDQDVEAQFLGVRYAILQLNVVGPDTITFTGDLEQEIHANDLIRIEGTVADDGLYLCTLVAELAGVTTLTIADGVPWPTGAGGAVGTFARVASMQRIGYRYDIATATLATGALTIAGDVSDKFAAGDEIIIINSTGNDGYWVLLSVSTDGPPVTTTTLIVVGAALPSNVDDGEMYKTRQAFKLTANIPLLWSYESGIQNPFIRPPDSNAAADPGEPPLYNIFRGDVSFLMVNNAGATAANFSGRIGTNAIIF